MENLIKNKELDKHAYLILCHNNFPQLLILLKLIDYEYNDIYIHIDKKANEIPYEDIRNSVNKSNLFFTKRIKVTWGGTSLIKAEMILLNTATKKHYAYYHLLSGVDLPLHSQEYIHSFFFDNHNEYLRVENISNPENKYLNARLKKYHFLQNLISRDDNTSLIYRLEKKSIRIQKNLDINRTKNINFSFYYGDQWFSITHDLAKYIVANKRKIWKHFRFTYLTDEVFIQTLAMKSPYKDNIVGHCARLIDWKRGRPYVYKLEDYEELVSSDKLFARKFDISIDNDIVLKLSQFVNNS